MVLKRNNKHKDTMGFVMKECISWMEQIKGNA